NSFVLDEDLERMGFNMSLALEQIWTLSKAQALESVNQGHKLDAICAVLGIPVISLKTLDWRNRLLHWFWRRKLALRWILRWCL
ncbi:hypothetical protein KI387_020901, partial [Taxus chinensis]